MVQPLLPLRTLLLVQPSLLVKPPQLLLPLLPSLLLLAWLPLRLVAVGAALERSRERLA